MENKHERNEDYAIKPNLNNLLSSELTCESTNKADLKSLSELSVRGTSTCDDFLSVASGTDDLESFAASSFAGDAGYEVKDICPVCYGNSARNISFATHFCYECGLFGRFICDKCLQYHKKFTNHENVRSLKVAAAKARFM